MTIRKFLDDIMSFIFDELKEFLLKDFNLITDVIYNNKEGFIIFYDSNNKDISKGSISFTFFNRFNESVIGCDESVDYVKFDFLNISPFLFGEDSSFFGEVSNLKKNVYTFFVTEESCISYKECLTDPTVCVNEITFSLFRVILGWLCLTDDFFNFYRYKEKLERLEGELVF